MKRRGKANAGKRTAGYFNMGYRPLLLRAGHGNLMATSPCWRPNVSQLLVRHHARTLLDAVMLTSQTGASCRKELGAVTGVL